MTTSLLFFLFKTEDRLRKKEQKEKKNKQKKMFISRHRVLADTKTHLAFVILHHRVSSNPDHPHNIPFDMTTTFIPRHAAATVEGTDCIDHAASARDEGAVEWPASITRQSAKK